jgi:hypothetical protein
MYRSVSVEERACRETNVGKSTPAVRDERVRETTNAAGVTQYSSEECVIAPEDPAGWEAAPIGSIFSGRRALAQLGTTSGAAQPNGSK